MALQNTVSIYQADLMHITPEADASIYGYQGDWVLYGADITTDTNGVTIGAGKMLIAGRLVEISQPTELPLTQVAGATSFHLSLEVDLTQTNSESAGVVTNNQFQFVLTTEDPHGNLLAGDTQALITVADINTTAGTVTPVIWPHDMDATLSVSSGWKSRDPQIQLSKRGKVVTLVLSAARDGSSTNTTITTIPAWATPRTDVMMTCASNNQISGTTMATIDCVIGTNGVVRIVHVPINADKYITGTASWTLA